MPDSTSPKSQLIGSVQERRPSSSSSNFTASITKTGFPLVQHRSKSAFSRSREERQKATHSERRQGVPVVIQSPKNRENRVLNPQLDLDDDWRRQISKENERILENMTEEEREQEKREVLERFGENVGDILKKVKAARKRSAPGAEAPKESSMENSRATSPRPALKVQVKLPSQDSTPAPSRPSSRADRKLRFAAVTPQDVHFYESAPPSPRKKPLALLPRSDSESSVVPVISLGNRRIQKLVQSKETTDDEMKSEVDAEPEEGSPEFIRRRYFPNQPVFDPSLNWIRPVSANKDETETDSNLSTIRFDLSGKVIPADLRSTLPTHLGLHHHANGEYAGYTLDDVFLLSRSTVPAQRSTMLRVLSRIAWQLGRCAKGDYDNGILELKGQEEVLRRRILLTGIEAMGERGSVGAMAIEVIWECLVRWDDVQSIEGVELKRPTYPDSVSSNNHDNSDKPSNNGDIIASLPLEQFVLPQISDAFLSANIPQESLSQLLSILHRFAQHTNEIATNIVSTPNLISNLFCTFILTPIPPTDLSLLPNPDALNLLCTLASASRSNANALTSPADSLLRFVAFLPTSSPYPSALSVSLLIQTLRLYAVFGSYGIYSHIATTAALQFSKLHQYVLSPECDSKQLRSTWFELLHVWIVCATDPHKTSPSHEILWSQISSWSWGPDALAFKTQLTSEDSIVWVSLWKCLSAWLEGARINSVRAGETERDSVVEATKPGFDHGVEKDVVTAAFNGLQTALNDFNLNLSGPGNVSIELLCGFARHADVLASSLRLWLACTPPVSQQEPKLESPPFSLPFVQFTTLSAKVVRHQLWSQIYSELAPSYSYACCRPLTLFLSFFLRFSRRLPMTTNDLWMAQAFAILCRIMPGDEDFGQQTVEELIKMGNPNVEPLQLIIPPSMMEAITESGGIEVILPFLLDAFNAKKDEVPLGPSCITPRSISQSMTLRLPGMDVAGRRWYPLPLSRDWIFEPLNHLLRSSTSRVLKSLPASWDGSEVAVVRGTLLLAQVMREVLTEHGLEEWTLSMAETAFGCMKVFMLEHEQQNEDSVEEVFRDGAITGLMEDLLGKLSASAFPSPVVASKPAPEQDSLQAVASRFLNHSTPFFQYYTDFVGLYDAISFGHHAFSRLLITPTSMRYPIDYRKYLWGDYSHVLRNVRIQPGDILVEGSRGAEGLSDYLWPIERNAEVLGFYLRALVRQGTLVEDGFLRWIAVHHVASNIWEDLVPLSGGESEEWKGGWEVERAGKLLKAVVDQGGIDVVKDVVRYVQNTRDGEPLLIPPKCFKSLDRRGEQRLEFIGLIGGDVWKERFRPLLEQVEDL